MSDMQLYLIALGALIIATVILFNWWQERRFSQDAIRRFDAPADDALMDELPPNHEPTTPHDDGVPVLRERFEFVIESRTADADEPRLADIPEDTPLAELPGGATQHPKDQAEETSSADDVTSMQDAAQTESASAQTDVAADRFGGLPANIDVQIDLTGLVILPSPMHDEDLPQALHPLPHFAKTTQWFGLDQTDSWHALTDAPSQRQFTQLACALQLADRSGVLPGADIHRFQHAVTEIAAKTAATLEWHPTTDSVRYATELDQFCIEVDVMVGFHIQQGANGPFAATKLRGLVEANGMILGEDGTFHLQNEDGETLFTLVNQDQRPFTPEILRTAFIRGVSFQMDVPRVRNCPEVFNQMALIARKMESSLGGELIDDNQTPLNSQSMEQIRDQLRVIYAKMIARGITPGSASALRLFS